MDRHKHQLSSGWIRDGQVYRECVGCRSVFVRSLDKQTKTIKSDFNYYKGMADYYGIN
jgi:hypothetical protein